MLEHAVSVGGMTEEILSTATGNLAEVDGMLRAVVVTRQAAGAATVVVPGGESVGQRDVARGTHLHALAAMDAGFRIDGELLVCHHTTVEIAAHHMAHRPRSRTFPDMNLALFPIDNHS